jgi:hypothetical protein
MNVLIQVFITKTLNLLNDIKMTTIRKTNIFGT